MVTSDTNQPSAVSDERLGGLTGNGRHAGRSANRLLAIGRVVSEPTAAARVDVQTVGKASFLKMVGRSRK